MTGPDRDATDAAVEATGTSLAVLDAVRRLERAGVTALASDLDFPKSTVHRHLSTLAAHDFVVNDGGEYRIGLRLLAFGEHARRRELLYRVGKDKADEVAAETGETVQLVVAEGGVGVYLYQVSGDRGTCHDAHAGTRFALHTTAAGKAILAHYDEERVAEVIDDRGLADGTENAIDDPDDLRAELAEIRERTVAFDDEEYLPGIRCVAIPITTEAGEVLGALSVSAPTDRFQDERFREEVPALLENSAAAAQLNASYASVFPLE